MLTGEAPANALTRAAAVLAGKPDPMKPAHALNPAIPPTLGAVLQQAMSPGINKRFASAAAMRTALQMVHQSITTNKENPEDAASFNSAGEQTIVLSTSETSVSAPRLHEVLDMARAAPTSAAGAPLIVSQLGQGHFPSITAALEAAAPGTRILVRPGLYQEQLIITKPVEIIGDGPQAGIIIESSAEHVLVMQAEQATVRGLTLRGYTDTNVLDTPARATVNVPRGRLALEQCDIASDNRLCVLIHGALADPSLWRCKIHSSNGVGVLIYGRAHGRLEECDIYEHAQAGIVVRSSANPTIRRCKIHHCAQDGIYVDQKGMGVIEECDISQNARAGIEIRRDSTPLLRHCTIHHQTEGYGIFICEHGEGIIEECDISQNARAGVAIVQNSTPLLRRCKIHRERQRGIFFSDQAQGVIERCEIVENARVGIEIRRESNPIVRYCKINRHGAVGIWVHDGGAGMVEHSDLTGNTRGALLIEEGCRVLQRDNTK
jgi:parallel beta-helix repeat protein